VSNSFTRESTTTQKVFTVVIIKSKCLRRHTKFFFCFFARSSSQRERGREGESISQCEARRKNLTRRRSLAHARLAFTPTGEFERVEVLLINVAGDVVAVKARRVKARNLSVHAQARLQQIFDSLVN